MIIAEKRAKELCLALILADSEDKVIELLKGAELWDNPAAWRYFGDRETNYNAVGNQQSRPEAALVEKLINSVDARLANECIINGIDPEGLQAPQNIREAVARFFEDNPKSPRAGLIKEWPNDKRTKIAREITLAATGNKPPGNPCFSIADCGEGQTPEMMPQTLLSLDKQNKFRIPFVQGKFNMGGTGVLKFCGRHNLQFILSRRNPTILNGIFKHPSDLLWGFTIVRREDPERGARSSVYTYLAPLECDQNPRYGGVLRFSSDSMPIFPEGNKAYSRCSKWGTLIKLYEYSAKGFRSHILMKDGLLNRVDLLLPDIALPARFHECRDYRGHEGSPETTLNGLKVRLGDDKANNLEDDFPASFSFSLRGEKMQATIYAFKKGRAETYRQNEGIIFTVNGQTHGHLTTDFFRRNRVGLSYLRDSILVIVDCNDMSVRAREDLFMNSRDRLSGGDFRAEIESELEEELKGNKLLRDLKERRRREDIQSKLEDSKPLGDILESLLKNSPTLSELFLMGKRIPTPFKTKKAKESDKPYQGKTYPTYFKFKDKDYGELLYRECHINKRCRISFETDAANDYFDRDIDKGEFQLILASGNENIPVKNYSLNLQNGLASLNFMLPDNCKIGDELVFLAIVTDRSRIDPFENRFQVNVLKEAQKTKGGQNGRKKPPEEEEGTDREMASGIALPNMIRVYENPADESKSWNSMDPPFDKYSALRIINAGQEDNNTDDLSTSAVYDFFINVDNIYLKAEQKVSKADPKLIEARFIYGEVLIGLALLLESRKSKKLDNQREAEQDIQDQESKEVNIEDKVEQVSKAVAPVLLPIIENLGALDIDDKLFPDRMSGEAV